jgi:ATP-binding cassette subfamily B protein
MGLPRIYAGRRRRLLWRLVANGLAQAAILLASALLLRRVLAPGAASPAAMLCLAGSGALLVLLRVHAAGVGERLGQDYVMRVRMRIFEAIAARPVRAERGTRAGVAMTRVISDLGSLRNWVTVGLARSAVACVTLTGSIGVLAWFQPRAALVLLAVGGAGVCLAAALAPVLRGYVREARRRRGRLANNLGERLLASRTVQQLGRMRIELRRVRTHSEWLRDALVRRARAAEALHALPELVTPATIAAWILLAGPADSREMAAGILLLGVLGASLRDLARAVDHRLAFEEGRRRIAMLLAGPRLEEKRHARELEGVGPVVFALEEVSVDGVLSGLTLTAKAGERVLVTGRAGQGKSTLLALAARLLDPDSGQVRLDGESVRRLSFDSLHAAVQMVSPELPLLRGSIADNLLYGADDDDTQWLEQVVQACGLASDPALAEGLSSHVEERGANLSAGLRARVSLARALAMRPRLLLVDDPTFTLDAAAAAALRSGCALLGATTLVVAPEDSELLSFDRVWFFADGDVEDRPICRAAQGSRVSSGGR